MLTLLALTLFLADAGTPTWQYVVLSLVPLVLAYLTERDRRRAKSVEALVKRIEKLEEERDELRAENAALRAKCDELQAEVDSLREQLDRVDPSKP